MGQASRTKEKPGRPAAYATVRKFRIEPAAPADTVIRFQTIEKHPEHAVDSFLPETRHCRSSARLKLARHLCASDGTLHAVCLVGEDTAPLPEAQLVQTKRRT